MCVLSWKFRSSFAQPNLTAVSRALYAECISSFLDQVKISATAETIRQSLGDMPNNSNKTLARMASRCYNFAQQSCVWVDAAIKLDLAHPGLERSCLDFSGMTMEDIMIVFDDPIYFDSLRFCVHSGGEMAEAIQRVNLWDKLIGHLLNTEEPDILGLKPEHGISPYLGLREGRIVDLVAVSNQFQLPILFVEASRERVLPGNQHKDFSKMATTMIQACIQNGELLNSHGCDVALAKVFGIWTGGSQARFCIAHPMKRVVGNRIEATIMFSAPDCWCFDLLRFPNGPCCGQTCCNFEGIESIPSSTCTTTIERLCAMPEFAAPPLDQTAAEVALTTSNPVPIEEVNYVAAAALRYFCNQVRSHAEDLNNWDAANLPPDEPFENTVMPELHYLCAQSRVNQFGASPQKPRSGEGKDGAGSAGLVACLLANPMELGERGPYIDEDKEQYFLIKKPLRAGRELEILTAIETSVLAPTLANCVIYPEEDSCVYQFDPLEAVDAQYVPLYDFIPKNGTDLYWHILGGVTCAIHTLCGLYLLHNTYRIVHSNISKHSIMFSKSRKLWKIVGYGYAYGIDESSVTPRTVGPDGYKVPEIGNRGIFTTASDVYSLGKALNDLWFGTLDHMIEYGVGERGARELFEAFYPLVVKMMAQDPAERPTVFAALSAFTSIYSEKVWPYEDFVFLSADSVFEIVTKITYRESIRAEYARACPKIRISEQSPVPSPIPKHSWEVREKTPEPLPILERPRCREEWGKGPASSPILESPRFREEWGKGPASSPIPVRARMFMKQEKGQASFTPMRARDDREKGSASSPTPKHARVTEEREAPFAVIKPSIQ